MSTGPTFPFQQTPEIFTGNPATVNDPYDATKPNNGARMALGTRFYQTDSAGSPFEVPLCALQPNGGSDFNRRNERPRCGLLEGQHVHDCDANGFGRCFHQT